MISIQDNPRFKKDCERFNRAIKESKDESVKKELKSLYDQFLSLVKQLDQGYNSLVVEKIINNTQQDHLKNALYNVRVKLESKISTLEIK